MKIEPQSSFSLYGASNVQSAKKAPTTETKQVEKCALDMMDSIGRAQVVFKGDKNNSSEFLSFDDKLKMLKEKGVNDGNKIGEFLALPEEEFMERIKYAAEGVSMQDISEYYNLSEDKKADVDKLLSIGLNLNKALYFLRAKINKDFLNFALNNPDIDINTLEVIYFKLEVQDAYLSAIRAGEKPIENGKIIYDVDENTVFENIPRLSKMGLDIDCAANFSNIKPYMLDDIENAYNEKKFDILPSIVYARSLENSACEDTNLWQNGFYFTKKGYLLPDMAEKLTNMPKEKLNILKELSDIGIDKFEFEYMDDLRIQDVMSLKKEGYNTQDAYYLSALYGEKFEKCAEFVKKGIPAQVGREILFLSDEEADKVASHINEGYEPELAAGTVRYHLNDDEIEKAVKYHDQYKNSCLIAKDERASEIADFYLENDMAEENKNFYSKYEKDKDGYQKILELQKRGFKNDAIDYFIFKKLTDEEIEKAAFYINKGLGYYDAAILAKANIPEDSKDAAIILSSTDNFNCAEWLVDKMKEVEFPLNETASYVADGTMFRDAVDLSTSELSSDVKNYYVFCNKYLGIRINTIKELEKYQEIGLLNSENKVNIAKEFIRRGTLGDSAILYAQLDYNNKEEIYRTAELHKLGVEFLDAYNCAKNKEEYESKKEEYKKNCYSKRPVRNIESANIVKIKGALNISLDDACDIHKNYHNYASKFSEYSCNVTKLLNYVKENSVNIEYAARFLINSEARDRFENLLSEEINSKEAMIMAYSDIEPSDENKIKLIKKLLSKDFAGDINKKVQNPNIKKWIDKIFDFENLNPESAKKLLESDLTYDEIVDLASDFSRKSLKLAMKKPNQYLSNIPLKLTTKINGKLPVLTGGELERYQNKFAIFCKNKLTEILKAQQYLDSDTFNQLMDKRDANFGEYLDKFQDVEKDNLELISKLIKLKTKEGKPLTAKEKIELSKIVIHSQFAGVSLQDLNNLEYIDIKELKQNLTKKAFLAMGFSESEFNSIPKERLNFDEDYVHLLLQSEDSGMCRDIYNEYIKPSFESEALKKNTIAYFEDMLKQKEDLIHEGIDPDSLEKILEYIKYAKSLNKNEIYPIIKTLVSKRTSDNNTNIEGVVRAATLYDFREYIQDENNPIGQANSKTKDLFIKNSLNYNAWFNKNEDLDVNFKLNDKDFKITMWDRCPQKDLFLGNKTSCCTGLGEPNGSSTPIYLANSAFNVVELKDDKGNTVAMSRIYMANVENSPALIMENIEVNNEFLKHLNVIEQHKIVNKFVQYMKNLSKKVTGNNSADVYFSTSFSKLDTENLERVYKEVNFIGDVSSENFYSNTLAGWVDIKEFKDKGADFYKV